MCGRYSLALRPSQVRVHLERHQMPVCDAPEDEADDAPRQTYNFAPGYNGLVYRADVPDFGAGPRPTQHTHGDEDAMKNEDIGKENETHEAETEGETRYKLQAMKWGLIPFWTKRKPDYGSMMKTINCRDDSLIENRGMWNTMKHRKRCIIVAQGFYEWLKKGKEKIPHYIKRKDGQLICLAGLWDCVQYEGSDEKLYTYTIITTNSNKQLEPLHDRMPVVLDNGSEDMWKWLDPKRYTWSRELQSVLKPYQGELEVYPVSRDVGKVGNDSPTFIVPISSAENKSNIANFFSSTKKPKAGSKEETAKKEEQDVKSKSKEEATKEEAMKDEAMKEDDIKSESKAIKQENDEKLETVDHRGTEDNAPLPLPKEENKHGIKREHVDDEELDVPVKKAARASKSPQDTKHAPTKSTGRKTRSATSNDPGVGHRKKTGSTDQGSSRKITGFFGKKS